ncbi:MAG: hypothetical protein Q4F75_10065, partial [Pseudomonadota bacterium]|nr:hypothetical protein [Pseudomonadota bacterium]
INARYNSIRGNKRENLFLTKAIVGCFFQEIIKKKPEMIKKKSTIKGRLNVFCGKDLTNMSAEFLIAPVLVK